MDSVTYDLKKGKDFIGVTCVFICHDGEGNILLQKRSENCRDERGRWDCGSGSMEFGEESFEQALCREVKEEYGVEPIEMRLKKIRNVVREHEGQKTHWVALVHAVKIPRGQEKIGEPDFMDEIRWFRHDDLPDPLHSQFQSQFEFVKDEII